ncbi:MAG: hypothetical protein ACI9EF_003437, partial [Pseudohongiellaceae bacterium]
MQTPIPCSLLASRLAQLALCLTLWSCSSTTPDASVYTRSREIHGVPILATAAVDEAYVHIAASIYEHMTSSTELLDIA